MVFGLFDDEEEDPQPLGGERYTQRAFRATGQSLGPKDLADATARREEREAEAAVMAQRRAIERQQQEQEEDREVDSYAPGDVNALTLRTRANNPDAEDPDQEPAFIRSSANFLFGDEMAIMGVKWDKDGMTWKAETAKDMWSDHPIMSGVALAGIAFPFLGGLRGSAKVGKLAVAGAKLAAGKEAGILGNVYKAGRGAGILPETLIAKHGDNWTALGDELLDVVDEDAVNMGATSQTLKYFDDEFASVVKAEIDPAKRLEMIGGRKRLQEILLETDKRHRMKELAMLVEGDIGDGSVTAAQKIQYALQKRFSNDYFNLGNRINKAYISNMNKFWDNAKFDELFKHELDEGEHLPFFKYLNDKHDPADFAKLTPAKQQYFERTRNRYWAHQNSVLESGFETPETVARIGKAHIAALNAPSKGGISKQIIEDAADITGTRDILERGGVIRHYPKLTSPTLLERKKSLDEVMEAAAKGEIITHPDDIHRTSIIRDEMLHTGYKFLRDMANKAGDTTSNAFSLKPEAFDKLTDAAKKNWVSLDELPGVGVAARLRRMVAKSAGKNADEIDRMPYLHQNVIDEFFDPEGGAFSTVESVGNALSLLTMMHKPAKTVFNLPSHFQNGVSNLMYFMPMAGVNPFKADVLTDLKRANEMVWGIAKEIASMQGGDKAKTLMSSRDLLMDIAKKNKVDTTIVTNAGTKLDLVDEIMDPRVRQMIEEQSFDNAEGFSAINKFYTRLNAAGARKETTIDSLVKAGAKAYVEGIKSVDKKTRGLLSKSSAAYLAEDMTPKLATYMQFRKRGLSIEQSVMMVSRKFPQYNTVGKTIKGARKFALPWITFPAEVARIMKNNLTDRPIASAMWFQAAGANQAAMSGLGFAPMDPDTIAEAKEGAPFWANKPSTVVTSSAGQGMVGGAFTGAAAGGIAGTLKAGPLGFAVGSAAGAVVGAGIGAWGSKGDDSLRAWTLDFLPHSAILPQSYDVHMDPGANMVKEALKASPIEPLSVFMPVLRLMMGEDEYGQEIVADSGLDYTSKAVVQTFGMITPPWIQKYGLRVGAPDRPVGLEKVAIMSLGGTAGALAGARIGGKLGVPGGQVAGSIAGAGLGLALGSQLDYSRFEEDIGLRTNSRTGERGNPVFDVLFTSMTGLGKSWKVDPGGAAFNEKFRDDNLKTYRSSIKRKMGDAAVNGDEERWNSLMQDYFMTYNQQYDDPRKAQSKFSASMDDFIPQLRRNPQYKRLTEEELRHRLREATAFAIKHRGDFTDKRVEELRQEIIAREISRHKKGDAIGWDSDIDFNKGISIGDKSFW